MRPIVIRGEGHASPMRHTVTRGKKGGGARPKVPEMGTAELESKKQHAARVAKAVDRYREVAKRAANGRADAARLRDRLDRQRERYAQERAEQTRKTEEEKRRRAERARAERASAERAARAAEEARARAAEKAKHEHNLNAALFSSFALREQQRLRAEQERERAELQARVREENDARTRARLRQEHEIAERIKTAENKLAKARAREEEARKRANEARAARAAEEARARATEEARAARAARAAEEARARAAAEQQRRATPTSEDAEVAGFISVLENAKNDFNNLTDNDRAQGNKLHKTYVLLLHPDKKGTKATPYFQGLQDIWDKTKARHGWKLRV